MKGALSHRVVEPVPRAVELAWPAASSLGAVAVFYPELSRRARRVDGSTVLVVEPAGVLPRAAPALALASSRSRSRSSWRRSRRLEKRADADGARRARRSLVAGGGRGRRDRPAHASHSKRCDERCATRLRSTEEVNLDLERRCRDANRRPRAQEPRAFAGDTRQADPRAAPAAALARSSRRSASWYVAGIVHEINNPVNAIVNTVVRSKKRSRSIDDRDAAVRSDAARDVARDGSRWSSAAPSAPRRSSAMHNYSRTDDESVGRFRHRSFDRRLARGSPRHLLKQNVIRSYKEVQ